VTSDHYSHRSLGLFVIQRKHLRNTNQGGFVALITGTTRITKERDGIHQPTECSASIVSRNGERFLQLDTYGSSDRQLKGKVSQSIQISASAAAQVLALIYETFPALRSE
jgi:hypothetical protein